jgi:hypothetical protein
VDKREIKWQNWNLNYKMWLGNPVSRNSPEKTAKRSGYRARCLWLMPIILVTQEAEIRRIKVQNQPGQTVPLDPISKKKHPLLKGLVECLKVKALSSSSSTTPLPKKGWRMTHRSWCHLWKSVPAPNKKPNISISVCKYVGEVWKDNQETENSDYLWDGEKVYMYCLYN